MSLSRASTLLLALCALFLLLAAGGNELPNCPAQITVDRLKNDCVLATSTTCSAKCKKSLEIANTGRCVTDLLDKGKKYGFGANLACAWRPACDLDQLAGVNCPQPKQSPGNTASTSFKGKGPKVSSPQEFFSNKTLVQSWALAYSRALGVRWGDVILSPAAASRRRLATAIELEVTVYSQNVSTASKVADSVRSSVSFATKLVAALQKDPSATGTTGLVYTDLTPDTSSIKSAALPKYMLPEYIPTADVETLHSYTTGNNLTWDLDPNPSEGEERSETYFWSLVALFVVVLVVFVLAILEFFFFSCFHSCKTDCCKKCCCNEATAFPGKQSSRVLLALFFVASVGIMLGTFEGRNYLQDGVNDVSEVLGNVSDIMHTLEGAGRDLDNEAKKFESMANTAMCQDSKTQAVLKDTAREFKTAASKANDFLQPKGGEDALSVTVDKAAKDYGENVPKFIDYFFIAAVSLFCIFAVFGLLSILCKSGCAICFTNILGVLVLIILMIEIAWAVTTSVALADFCYYNPLNTTSALVERYMTDADQVDNADMLQYYLQCDRENKAAQPLTDAQDFMETLRSQTKNLADSGQCNVEDMMKVYKAQTGIADSAKAALRSLQRSVSCETITPLLVKVSYSAVCDNMVSGLFRMWVVQVVACVGLWLTMHYALFVAAWWHKKEEPKSPPVPGSSIELGSTADKMAQV